MVRKHEFLNRLAEKGNPRWTKEGFEKDGYQEGNSKWNHKEAEEIYNAFLDTLVEFLVNGEAVCFSGFGKFEIRETKGRSSVGLDLSPIKIPSHKRVHFTQGGRLKRLVDVESGE